MNILSKLYPPKLNTVNTVNTRNKGFTVVEMIVVTAIMAVLAGGAGMAAKSYRAAAAGKAIGSQLNEALGGLTSYQTDNYVALVTGVAIPGFANALTPTVAELITGKYLNSSFNDKGLTSAGFGWFIERFPTGCTFTIPPTANPCKDLRATVNTKAPILDEDGVVNYGLLNAAVEYIGNDASYSTDVTPGTIYGKNQTWNQLNPQVDAAGVGMTGIILAHAGYDMRGLSQFVRRNDERDTTLNGGLDVIGTAGLTAPNGRIDTFTSTTGTIDKVNSKYIDNEFRVTTEDAQFRNPVTENSGCAPNGILGRDANGVSLYCESSKWKSAPGSLGGMFDSCSLPGGRCWPNPVGSSGYGCPTGFTAQIISNFDDRGKYGHAIYFCMKNIAAVVPPTPTFGNTLGGSCSPSGTLDLDDSTGYRLNCVSSVWVSVAVGNSCYPNGTLAANDSGTQLICQSSLWAVAPVPTNGTNGAPGAPGAPAATAANVITTYTSAGNIGKHTFCVHNGQSTGIFGTSGVSYNIDGTWSLAACSIGNYSCIGTATCLD